MPLGPDKSHYESKFSDAWFLRKFKMIDQQILEKVDNAWEEDEGAGIIISIYVESYRNYAGDTEGVIAPHDREYLDKLVKAYKKAGWTGAYWFAETIRFEIKAWLILRILTKEDRMRKLIKIGHQLWELCKTFFLFCFFCQLFLIFISIPLESGLFFDQPGVFSKFEELFNLYTGKVLISLWVISSGIIICRILWCIFIRIHTLFAEPKKEE